MGGYGIFLRRLSALPEMQYLEQHPELGEPELRVLGGVEDTKGGYMTVPLSDLTRPPIFASAKRFFVGMLQYNDLRKFFPMFRIDKQQERNALWVVPTFSAYVTPLSTLIPEIVAMKALARQLGYSMDVHCLDSAGLPDGSDVRLAFPADERSWGHRGGEWAAWLDSQTLGSYELDLGQFFRPQQTP
ncbi:MAG: hypothetical protein UY16_C0030G0002 [Candidatus Gottesmanbacteria bacterium GW2011_GWA2_47_9]|uniref:Uncharacterized protein n=1 Tax=Candidatus Gottesmanbacteria bacterium GW2011_GWA2_47_9 TaxID=1618445 RepID=A0A0G1TZS3_9BACT|nr:MAG: hypothetical protein UY16_C0030G0002 [Candidatus Gottesmanbacteria bacterium GW2011_GWA2_47_9]